MAEEILRPLFWVGSSKRDLLGMPAKIVDMVGYALYLAQRGVEHPRTKVLTGFGSAGVLEIVENDEGGTYRAVYTVLLENAVYVLHCFQKKSTRGIRTPKRELDLIHERFRMARKHSGRI